MDDIHRIRNELECLMKKFQDNFQEYKNIKYDSKLKLRLNYDKEIGNQKYYTLKNHPKQICGGGKLKIEGSRKLYVKYPRKRIEIPVHTEKMTFYLAHVRNVEPNQF